MTRRLERSTTNRVVGGVCGGLAEYLQVDPTLVRAFFVIAGIFSAGLFILVYIAMLILMPLPGQRAPIDDLWPSARTSPPARGTSSEGASADTTIEGVRPAAPANGEEAERRRATIGYVLVALGVIFLLSNAGALRFVQWNVIWPLVVIALGVLLVMQRSRG